MSNDSHKHLNNERLSQKQNKTYFADVTFSESCMGTPDNLQNFKFLKSRVYEIWGGGGGSASPHYCTRFGYQKSQYRKSKHHFTILDNFHCTKIKQNEFSTLN